MCVCLCVRVCLGDKHYSLYLSLTLGCGRVRVIGSTTIKLSFLRFNTIKETTNEDVPKDETEKPLRHQTNHLKSFKLNDKKAEEAAEETEWLSH